jgi:hypothetical protein
MPAPEWTIAEACEWLHPPIEPRVLGGIVKLLGIEPVGVRRRDTPGRPVATYDGGILMAVHSAVSPWLPVEGHEARC